MPRIKQTVTVRRNSDIPGDLGRLMPELAERTARHVRERTAAGLDVNGRPFKPRADGSPSRLTDSGEMIASFQPRRVDDRGFVLAPSGATARRAYVHQAGNRQWIGIEESVIEQHIEELTDAFLDRDRTGE